MAARPARRVCPDVRHRAGTRRLDAPLYQLAVRADHAARGAAPLGSIPVGRSEAPQPDAAENLVQFKKKIKKKIYPISCVSDEGFEALKTAMLDVVLNVRKAEAELGDDD